MQRVSGAGSAGMCVCHFHADLVEVPGIFCFLFYISSCYGICRVPPNKESNTDIAKGTQAAHTEIIRIAQLEGTENVMFQRKRTHTKSCRRRELIAPGPLTEKQPRKTFSSWCRDQCLRRRVTPQLPVNYNTACRWRRNHGGAYGEGNLSGFLSG